jgi:ribosomal protein L29
VGKSRSMTEIRELTSEELREGVRLLKEKVAKMQLGNRMSAGQPAVPVKNLKKEVAKMLTVMRQRQLALEGMQKNEERPQASSRRPNRSEAILKATLVTDKYPLTVGNEYRLILRRSGGVSQLTFNYAGGEPVSKSKKEVKKRRQKEYVIRIFSKSLVVVPDSRTDKNENDEQKYTMGEYSQLSIRLTPQTSGDCDLDVFVYSKNNLLQLLQLSFPAQEKAA